jgi:glycerate kinase
MRVVIAPDKFKGCLTASEAAEAMAAGVKRALPDAIVDCCPMADGGEGTVEALVTATGGKFVTRRVTGPLPEMKVDARFGILGDGKTAIIEMAAASGLALLRHDERNPMFTTTFGTGELMMAAVEMGVLKIILGIGGSATIDGGIGCAQACGLPVILEGGEPLSATEPLVGGDLPRVVLIKHGRGSAIERVEIEVACDVENPLCGPNGAAVVYGPQKGANAEEIRRLDADLMELARRCGKTAETNLKGAGAAGGLGFAMAAFFGGRLMPGIEIVMEATGFKKRIAGADFCVSGEGKLDAQSLSGKVAGGVAAACREAGVKCFVVAGAVDRRVDYHAAGIDSVVGLMESEITLAECMTRTAELLEEAAFALTRAARESRTVESRSVEQKDPHPNPPPEYQGRGKD